MSMDSKVLSIIFYNVAVLLFAGCEPERISIEGPPINAHFIVEPNTDIVKVGDTVYLSLEIPAHFLLNNGDSQFIFDGDFDLPISMKKYDISEPGSVWSLPSLQDCYTFSIYGYFSKNKNGTGVTGVNTLLTNGVYLFKMGIIPLKQNIFWFTVTRDGYFHSGKLNTYVYSDFAGVNRNHHLIDTIPGMQGWLSTDAANKGTYAFVVH